MTESFACGGHRSERKKKRAIKFCCWHRGDASKQGCQMRRGEGERDKRRERGREGDACACMATVPLWKGHQVNVTDRQGHWFTRKHRRGLTPCRTISRAHTHTHTLRTPTQTGQSKAQTKSKLMNWWTADWACKRTHSATLTVRTGCAIWIVKLSKTYNQQVQSTHRHLNALFHPFIGYHITMFVQPANCSHICLAPMLRPWHTFWEWPVQRWLGLLVDKLA